MGRDGGGEGGFVPGALIRGSGPWLQTLVEFQDFQLVNCTFVFVHLHEVHIWVNPLWVLSCFQHLTWQILLTGCGSYSFSGAQSVIQEQDTVHIWYSRSWLVVMTLISDTGGIIQEQDITHIWHGCLDHHTNQGAGFPDFWSTQQDSRSSWLLCQPDHWRQGWSVVVVSFLHQCTLLCIGNKHR